MAGLSGFDMIFRAIGIDPNAFVAAIQEIQGMALSIAQKTAATDAKMASMEAKLDAVMRELGISHAPNAPKLIEHDAAPADAPSGEPNLYQEGRP